MRRVLLALRHRSLCLAAELIARVETIRDHPRDLKKKKTFRHAFVIARLNEVRIGMRWTYRRVNAYVALSKDRNRKAYGRVTANVTLCFEIATIVILR